MRTSPIRCVVCFLLQLIRDLAEAGEQPAAGEKPRPWPACTHYSKPPAQSTTNDRNGEILYAHDSSNGILLRAPKARNKYTRCLLFWRDSFTNPPQMLSVHLSHSWFPALHAKELWLCFLRGFSAKISGRFEQLGSVYRGI